MRKMILGFCCLVLATPAWAQGTPTAKDAGVVQVNHIFRGPACPEACPQACPQKICEPLPVKPHSHLRTLFSSKCYEYTLPNPGLRNSCDPCCTNTGKVRTKNVLLMRRVPDDCPATNCAPTFGRAAAPCATPACGPGQRILHGHHGGGAVAPAPVVETIPTRPMPLPK